MTALVTLPLEDLPRAGTKLPVIDTFLDDHAAGTVIGMPGPGGFIRLGRDVEQQVRIDHGALRFQPLTRPGWGRQGISYGPFPRAHGLALIVSITNGHNTSQGEPIPEHIGSRLWRWARGPGADSLPKRLWGWIIAPRKKRTLRRFVWWLRSNKKTFPFPSMNENLALGWFGSEAPLDPLVDGCGFVMHAAKGENGELWARVGDRCLVAFRRVKNLRIDYVVALRKRGAVYYASAMQNAHGLGSYPAMRPVAIDPFNDTATMYAGVHQCALGQIGFSVDTRVHAVHIGEMAEFSSPFGTAHAADALTGAGELTDSLGVGGVWQMVRGRVQRTESGAYGQGENCVALLAPDRPSGLVHVLCVTSDLSGTAGLAFRVSDPRNYWLLQVSGHGCSLLKVKNDSLTEVARDKSACLNLHAEHSIQILDSHRQIGCYLDGQRLFDRWFDDPALEEAPGVGIWFDGKGDIKLYDFEAHAREIPLPNTPPLEPHWLRTGLRTVFDDDFTGTVGALVGRTPRCGHGTWERTLGKGKLDIKAGGGAHVRGTLNKPNPGRTFYTLPWNEAGFADLEVTIHPPGSQRGHNHRCRCGVVFWQDDDNYVCFSPFLDDLYDGASIALFPKRHGFEEIYDAVWTMIGDLVRWGQPFRLRVVFDGENVVAFIGDEPIMQRRMTDLYPNDAPLRIMRVGIVVNWEWGDDTGSKFERFTARA